jgi:hypothetical protein
VQPRSADRLMAMARGEGDKNSRQGHPVWLKLPVSLAATAVKS